MTDEIPVARRHSALAPSKSDPWVGIQQLLQKQPWLWGMVALMVVILIVGVSSLLRPSPVPAEAVIPLPTPTSVIAPELEAPDQELLAEVAEPTGSRVSVLGHFAHQEAPLDQLEGVGIYHGREIQLRRNAAQPYREMSAAALAAGIRLVPISGFRSIADQEFLFFQRAQAQSLRPQQRAEVSAPPGYSEHHTGYAIDIGDGSAPQTDVEVSFEQTPAFGWLVANGARFGFELSFPRDNAQGISYEPWHWRYVGDRHSLETFYQARE